MDKNEQRAEKMAAREKCLLSRTRKQFEKTGKQGFSMCGRSTVIVKLTDPLTLMLKLHRMLPFNSFIAEGAQ